MVSDSSGPVPPRGLVAQLRSQSIVVKLILAVVLLVLVGPIVVGFGLGIAGGAGALVTLFLCFLGAFWLFFMGSPAAEAPVPVVASVAVARASTRYCTECGRAYAALEEACRECGTVWDPDEGVESVGAVASFLNVLVAYRWLFDPITVDRVQTIFEGKLRELREPAGPPEAVAPFPSPSAASNAGQGLPPPPGISAWETAHEVETGRLQPESPGQPAPQPRRPVVADARRAVIGWAAERQADILLYVGAFLLSVAAIIFVAYQGDTVGSTTRFVVLTAYAVGFLVLGLALHRWERVKEAGPAFLALGAILVPIDFVMLRTEILSEQEVATDVLVFFGSATSAALYFSLAGRGYGWLYAIPGALAALLAWGALGSILDFGLEWFGPWFLVIAASAYVAGQYLWERWRFARGLAWPGMALGAGALLWTMGIVGDDVDPAALPVGFLLATVALAAGLRMRVSLPALVALPAMAATTAGTAWWAAFGLAAEWQSMFVAAAAAGYLVVAHFDRRSRCHRWAIVAALLAGWALLQAHATVLVEGADSAALPATYAFVFIIAGAAFVRWRWTLAGAVLPVLGAMTLLAAFWSARGIGMEWYGIFAALASVGYLLLAHFDRESRARTWGTLAAVAAGAALIEVHSTVLLEGADSSALPATYGLVFLVADSAFARWRWTVAGVALPVLGAMTLLTAFWSARGIGIEWYGIFAALAAIGYLLLALFDRESRRTLWWGDAAAAAALALALAHARIPLDDEAERLALPITYAVVLATAVGAFARWRFQWRLAPAAVPALAVATALTSAWVRWDVQPEWFAAFLAPAAAGYVGLALMDAKDRARSWLDFAVLTGVIVGGAAYAGQQQNAANHAAVPVVLGQLLAVAAFVSFWWRTTRPETIAAVSPLAAGFGASLLWVTADMSPQWLPAWVAAAAGGYLVPAELDTKRRLNWRFTALSVGAAALVGSHVAALSVEPVYWQLPVMYALLLAGATWDAIARRDFGTLLPPALAAMLGGSTLWAAGAGPEWWPYPAIGIAIAMVLTRYWWRNDAVLTAWGWAYSVALGAGATLTFLPIHYSMPEHALATQLLATGLLLVAAIFAGGSIAKLVNGHSTALGHQLERILLVQGAFAFLFGAGAAFNGVADIAGADRAWVFVALAFVGWALVNLPLKRFNSLWTFAPVGLAGMTVAALVAAESPGTLTAVLALATVGPLAALPGGRRWTLLGLASAFLLLTVWAAWRWQDGNLAYLPLAFAAIAILQWTALLWLRRYGAVMREPDIVITAMSWVPWLLAAGVAGILLDQEQQQLASGASIADTEEWGLAAAVLGMAAAAVTAEGIRLRLRWLWITGSAGLLVALLMAIATASPSNVQAYTAPIGIYLVLLGLTFRRSPELAGHQLQVHEAVMLAGWLFLVLPPAAQSFDPGGGKFGLELIGIGVALLIVGLVLHARWLVPAAILTLTGVSLRLVTGGLVTTPYWLLLGIAGTALIGFGLLVLLEREAWDRFRAAVVRWWTETQALGGTLGGPTSAA